MTSPAAAERDARTNGRSRPRRAESAAQPNSWPAVDRSDAAWQRVGYRKATATDRTVETLARSAANEVVHPSRDDRAPLQRVVQYRAERRAKSGPRFNTNRLRPRNMRRSGAFARDRRAVVSRIHIGFSRPRDQQDELASRSALSGRRRRLEAIQSRSGRKGLRSRP